MRTLIRFVPAIIVLSWSVPAYAQTACTMDAKLCPDGHTYVGRDGNNNCEWEKCPDPNELSACRPYVCADGTTHPSCSEDGHVINYFAAPCLTHGGDANACTEEQCGPQKMKIKNWTCPDGSLAGPICGQGDDGACGWSVRDCPNDSKFTDVPTDHPNSDAIFYVKSHGIVEGYADGTYKPDATINRAEFTKILVGSFPNDGPVCKIAPFTDVDQTAWYAASAHTARCHGLVDGYPDGSFRPANPLNFAEAAKILAKAFQLEAVTTVPACETGDCPWYRGYVLMLEAKGAIPTSIASFDQKITRGEMAEMIYRLKMGGDKPSKTYEELVAPSKDTTFNVYFYTQNELDNAEYEASLAVVRRIPHAPAVADAALKALFAGPTAKEYAAGARTSADLTSLGASYNGVTIHAAYADPYGGGMLEDVAIVDFREGAFEVLNGAAGRQFMAKAAIEATLKQFPTIKNVFYSKDGEVWTMWDA